MANIELKNIDKFFSGVHALRDLSLQVPDEQFLVVVGPSGSGKTTLLRILAGLETPSSGEIFINHKKVTDVPTADRDVAMVFQSYSLYPHLNVRDNLALALQNRAFTESEKDVYYAARSLEYCVFGSFLVGFSALISFFVSGWFRLLCLIPVWLLFCATISSKRIRKGAESRFLSLISKHSGTLRSHMTKEQEIEKRIRSTAELLGIGTLLQRKPDQLSGGQRQRVALGRAIIRKPKVFLLDEPLSNLDAKLRTSMRAEIAELQRKLKITTVYVTHDQTEAMTLGQRIVVLNDGVVEQIGSPREVYSKPSNVFVASFIGNPPMNLIRGVLETKGSRPFAFVYDDNQGIRLSEKLELTRIPDNSRKEVVLGIRPEHLKVAKGTDSVQSAEGSAANMFIGVVVHVESLGNITYIHLKIGEHTKIILSFEGYSQFDIGNELHVEFSPDDVHFFDSETGTRI